MHIPFLRRTKPGVTFIELLLFMAILAIVASAFVPLLFSATENRLLQETIAAVENNGTQILRTLSHQVQHAEKILDPPTGVSAKVLAVQTGSGQMNPTIFGVSSGSLIMIRHATKEIISSPQVAVEDFRVQNTSNALHQSVRVSFRVSRMIRLEVPRRYSQVFHATYSLYPDNTHTGDDCGCAIPSCAGATTYSWQVCQNSTCYNAMTPLACQ